MFDFLKKSKEYVCCEDFQGGIHFDYTGLFYCATYFHSRCNDIPITPILGDIEKNYNTLMKTKKNDKKSFEKGVIINRCKNCFQLEKKVWKKNQKIDRIAISANRKCNSNCIYCLTHHNKEKCNNSPDVSIYDFIKKLIDKKQVDENCVIQFGGGEPTLHFEFEKIMKLFLSKPKYTMRIHTSAIKYSESISEAIKQTRCMVIASIDAGNSELYKKIKNVDEFDSVVETMKKYCSANENSNEPAQVMLKYIIIPNVNDKEEFIIEFLNLAKKIGCIAVRADIENNWFQEHKDNLDLIQRYLYLLKYFDIKAKQIGLYQFFNDAPLFLLDKYKKYYEEIIVE